MSILEGADTVRANLSKAIEDMKTNALKGAVRCGYLVEKELDEKPPLVPVDTGFLRSTYFVNQLPPGHEGETGVVMGYSAEYAEKVHEMVGARFKRPGAGAKFLQAAVGRNDRTFAEIIASRVKLP